MKNIVLIPSIIDPPNIPLNYSYIRSVFSKQERFEQLQRTIESVYRLIPSCCIVVVECSYFDASEYEYIRSHVDYFVNIYEENPDMIGEIYSQSKAMGEGTMTIYGLDYIHRHHLECDNLFKISGRYWLDDGFEYWQYENTDNYVHPIQGNVQNCFTCFYKLNIQTAYMWMEYLQRQKYVLLGGDLGFEQVFARFLQEMSIPYTAIDRVGIHGYVSICGSYIDM